MGISFGGGLGPVRVSYRPGSGIRRAVRAGRRVPLDNSTVNLSDRANSIGTACVIVVLTLIVSGSLWGVGGAIVCGSLAGLVALGMVWEYLPRSTERRYKIEVKEAERRILYAQRTAAKQAKRTTRTTGDANRRARAEGEARRRLETEGRL